MNLEIDKKLTPQKIKSELDKFIIGQDNVKKSIAICLSKIYFSRKYKYKNKGSRYRKKLISKRNLKDADNIKSHNMIISGKSGSGKTEILRQTAKLCKSPFIKVDAVRYTEVGFHGDDVDNIIRSLFKKTKMEFKREMKDIFWSFKSVESALEHIVMTSLLGKSYEKNEL